MIWYDMIWYDMTSVTDWLYKIFPHYLIKDTIFGKKIIEHKMRILIFSTTFVKSFIILKWNRRGIIIVVHVFSCKVPVILVRIWCNLNFLGTVSKNTEISNWVKIGPVGAELFSAYRRTNRQTWRSYLVAFRNFVNAANKKEADLWQSLS